MGTIENIFSQAIVQRLGWMLVHFVWQGFAAAIVLAVVLKLLKGRSANLRYLIACGGLVLIVSMPVITIQMIKAADVGPVPMPSKIEAEASKAVPVINVKSIDLPRQPEVVAVTPRVPLKDRIVNVFEPALPYIVFGWLVGVFGFSLWHLGGWTQLQRLRRRMVKDVTPAIKRKVQRFAGVLGIKRAVGIMESALVEVPTVIGWLKPVILLPASVVTGLTFEQIEAILAHELAHVKRHDYLVNILQTFVEILGFYHPAVWWVSQRIRIERENCCDDMAVSVCGDKICYAKALTTMEEIRGGYSLAVAASGGSLLGRIRRLVGKNSGSEGKLSWLPSVIAILLIAALLIPTALALSNGKSGKSGNSNNGFAASLANGVTVELVGICEYPSEGKQWWRPEGSLLETRIVTEDKSNYSSKEPGYELAFKIVAKDYNFIIRDIQDSKERSGINVIEPDGLTAYRVHVKKGVNTTKIVAGLAVGEWTTVAIRRGGDGTTFENYKKYKIIFSSALSTNSGDATTITVSDNIKEEQANRVVAIDTKGKIWIGSCNASLLVDGTRQQTYTFGGLKSNDIKECQFQVRPYQWVTFKNVSLKPDFKTDIQVEVGEADMEANKITDTNLKPHLQSLVEDFFKNNYRDITARKTIEWGEPAVDAEGNMSIRYKYEATIWNKDKIIENKVWTFDKQGKFISVRKVGAEDIYSLAGAKALVDDFFANNYRDITSRETIEWGEPIKQENGNVSIRYKYKATIWNKDKIIEDKVWTFDKQGKFISVRKVGAEDIYSLAGAKALVDDFFANNYRDITSRETIEWGQPVKQENGNVSIRYKYEATIWNKDKIIQNKEFTFDKDGKFVKVLDVTSSKADENQQSKSDSNKEKIPDSRLIVPGQRIGDFTFDMTKDDVLKMLGKPKIIFYEKERYTLEDLPRRYYMSYGDISFEILDGLVEEITALSPLYKFANGLCVGSSEQQIIHAFGDDFQLKATEWKDFLSYEDKGLVFEINKNTRAVMEINISKIANTFNSNFSTDVQGENSNIESKDGFKVTLANGVTAELVGVCDYPQGNPRFWQPDGSVPARQIYIHREKDFLDSKYGFILKVDGPNDMSFAWKKIEGSDGWWGSCKVFDANGTKIEGYQAAAIKGYDGRESTNIQIGIATGLWNTVASNDGRSMSTKGDSKFIFSRAYEADNAVNIVVSGTWEKDKVQRIAAIDVNGKVLSGGSGSHASDDIQQMTGRFYNVKLEQIKEFLVQTRPYQFITFKNVSLKPDVKTYVQVEVQNPSDEGKSTNEPVTTNGNIDLAVEDFDISPYPEGGLYDVTVTVRNKGNVTSQDLPIHFYRNDPEKKKPMACGGGALKPGEVFRECSMPFALKEGLNEISVVLDPDNKVRETDKKNNTALLKIDYKDGKIIKKTLDLNSSSELSVPPKSNVSTERAEKSAGKISGVDIYPSKFDIRLDSERGVCSLVVSIINNSDVTIPKFKLRFYRGDPNNNFDEADKIQNSWHEAGPIAPGKSWNEGTGGFRLPDGEYEFFVVLDYDNAITETDENNNIASIKVLIKDGKIKNNEYGVQVKKDKIEVQANYLSFPTDDNAISGFLKEIKKQSPDANMDRDPNAVTAFILNDEQGVKLKKLINGNPSAKNLVLPKVVVFDGEKGTAMQQKKIMFTKPNSAKGDLNELKTGIVMEVTPKLQGNEKIYIDLEYTDTRLLGFENGLPSTEVMEISSRFCMLNGSTLIYISNQPVKDVDDNGQAIERNKVLMIKAQKLDYRAS